MKITVAKLVLLAAFVVGSAPGCVREGESRACNENTLLLHFLCGDDLTSVDSMRFYVQRKGEPESPFFTKIKCPGDRFFEVKIPDYAVGQSFNARAEAMMGDQPAGPTRFLESIVLTPSCSVALFDFSNTGPSLTPRRTSVMLQSAKTTHLSNVARRKPV